MTKARDLANASTALSAVSATELGYLDGVTSAVQTQIDAKLASSTAATTYVANSLADAKGDIFVASADNTVTRLAVGSTGDTIVADSSTATGLRYQASTAAGRNFLINGGMDIAQRGTTFNSVSTVYTLDRWFFQPYGTATSANISQGSSDSVEGFRYYAKVAANTSSTSNFNFSQTIETANTVPLRGKTVTVSFYLRTPVAFSNVFTWNLRYSTSVDTRIENAGSGTAVGSDVVMTPTSTWTRYSQTFTIPTTASSLGLVIGTYNNTVATANFDITGVQLEIGSVATNFSRAGGTIQGELAACQRYFWRYSSASTGSSYVPFGAGHGVDANNCRIIVQTPVSMRTPPSISFSAASTFQKSFGNPMTSVVAAEIGYNSFSVQCIRIGEFAANQGVLITAAATTAAFIDASSEL